MVLKQKREKTDVLIVDASKGFTKEGKNNKLRASDIKRISDVVIARESIDKFSRVVSREEIRSNEYNLNIPRYVDSSESAETWDIYASMFGGIPKSEIETLKSFWATFPSLKDTLFLDSVTPYVELATDEIKTTIKNHIDVIGFENAFQNAFESFTPYLREELLNKMNMITISKEETILSDNIFERLQNFPIIDRYEAYQILDNEWTKIAVDLEIIQTEGFEATKQVDPNIVIKKKEGKEQEVQEGYVGHVIPFELVQTTLLKKDYDALRTKENRLSEIPSLYEEIIDSMTEDEKDTNVLNDSNDAFVAKEVTKKLKELHADADTVELLEFKNKLTQVDDLMKEEKELKAQIKKESADLHALTKTTIETLSNEQVYGLLEKKWIDSLVNNLHSLPETIVDSLVNKIQAMQNKYAVTFFEVETQIKETERLLCNMIDELVGDEFDMKGLSEFKTLLEGN